MSRHRIQLGLLLALLNVLICSLGCSQMLVFKENPFKIKKKEELIFSSAENPVAEVMCVWEPGEGTNPNGLPCRGVVGQILFFARGIPQPVAVNGDVSFYLFDNNGTEEEQSTPFAVYTFSAKEFQYFLTPTNLGATYQLFLPYTQTGGQRATCSVRLKFKPAPDQGIPIYSKMGTVQLPGMTSRKKEESLESIVAEGLTKKPTEKSQAEKHLLENDAKLAADIAVMKAASREYSLMGPDGQVNNNSPEDDLKRLRHVLSDTHSASPPTTSKKPWRSLPDDTETEARPKTSNARNQNPLAVDDQEFSEEVSDEHDSVDRSEEALKGFQVRSFKRVAGVEVDDQNRPVTANSNTANSTKSVNPLADNSLPEERATPAKVAKVEQTAYSTDEPAATTPRKLSVVKQTGSSTPSASAANPIQSESQIPKSTQSTHPLLGN